MLHLGRTARLSCSSDPCLFPLTCGAAFSLNYLYSIVLAQWYKRSCQCRLGEDNEGKRGNKKTGGKLKKGVMWYRITQQCKQSGQTALNSFLRIRRACGHFLMEYPNIRVIPFLAIIESYPAACNTTPHGKQDFIAKEVATKMFSKVSGLFFFFFCCLLWRTEKQWRLSVR